MSYEDILQDILEDVFLLYLLILSAELIRTYPELAEILRRALSSALNSTSLYPCSEQGGRPPHNVLVFPVSC
jgi:hypothetical protein